MKTPDHELLRPQILQTARLQARKILENAWRGDYCFPNNNHYRHLWLWDSSFHALAWAAFGDERGVIELESIFSSQLEDGFVPHMRYAGPTGHHGPLKDRSSFTQPPIYAHAAKALKDAGVKVPDKLYDNIGAGLLWLLTERRDAKTGLLYVVHPWETGQDDSPRFDSWIDAPGYNLDAYWAFDRKLVHDAYYNSFGAAVGSNTFSVAPCGFNALVAHACMELSSATGDTLWQNRGRELAAAIDKHLWDEDLGLWVDKPLRGGGASCRDVVLDGVLPALVSPNLQRCVRALEKTTDVNVFGGRFGPAFVSRDHRQFEPDLYWRGPAWPQINYLVWQAACRKDLQGTQAEKQAPILGEALAAGAITSRFAEYWNPENATSLGATPQTWAAVVAHVALEYDS